jgi:hypothetical protein
MTACAMKQNGGMNCDRPCTVQGCLLCMLGAFNIHSPKFVSAGQHQPVTEAVAIAKSDMSAETAMLTCHPDTQVPQCSITCRVQSNWLPKWQQTQAHALQARGLDLPLNTSLHLLVVLMKSEIRLSSLHSLPKFRLNCNSTDPQNTGAHVAGHVNESRPAVLSCVLAYRLCANTATLRQGNTTSTRPQQV